MKLFYFLILSSFLCVKVAFAQCFSIETILADACGDPEGANEMVTLKTYTDISINQLDFDWPNNSFLSWCADANLTAQLNNTIQNSCGFLLEPPAGIIPANEKVIIVSSTDMLITANSFEGLDDTIYIMYQCAGNTSGHFSNLANTPRSLTVSYSGNCSQSQTVTYLPTNLIGGDGGAVDFDTLGTPTYYNTGCNAPVNTLKPYWSLPSELCNDYGILNLNGFLSNVATQNGTWSGDVENGNQFNTIGKLGTYSITYTVSKPNSCLADKDSTITFSVTNPKYGRDTIIRCDSILQFGNWITKDTIIEITVENQSEYACDSTVARLYKIQRSNFTVTPNNVTINSGEIFPFSIIGNNNYSYTIWNNINNDTCYNPCSNNELTASDPTSFYIEITDENSGCTTIDTINVLVNYFSTLNIPNAFTPNNDGQNDLFKIYGKDLRTVNFEIFSRWGELLFKGTNTNESWNGTFKNKEIESGIYLLKLRASGKDGQKFDVVQKIKLIR
ncbi:MAG: gliding motility-associated C-terminal domain-containing protein [Chitinophagales bacterium]|nr:gliding motility-associated C-terminal domain-containing protein [Chitinophagales bacterium]